LRTGVAVVAACAGLHVASAHAQDRAQIAATAKVQVDPPTLTPVGNLQFGVLRRSTPVTVDAQASLSAVKLAIRGTSDIEFAIDFLLPEELEDASGRRTLPVHFGPDAACRSGHDDQAACHRFDPTVSFPTRHTSPVGTYYIWLGGSVDPGPDPAPGDYIGTITATLQYTGV
jgi:hypothetical protein